MILRTVLLIVLVGCGGGQSPDGDGGIPPGQCGTDGNGTVSGTVGGATINPVVRANQIAVGTEGVAIVLDESAGACGTVNDVGEHLVLLFCTAPAEGTHGVFGAGQFACPGPNAASLIENMGGADFAEATDGSVTITNADGACTSGSFSVNYVIPDSGGSIEQLTGSFNAVVCP